MATLELPDYIGHDLVCLSVGLNPSIPSAKAGFYFANPRNRFWKAFNLAGIVDTQLIPGIDAHELLLQKYKIGFTDVVKRPSRMGHELRANDYKRDAVLLREKIEKFRPRLIWLHGKVAASKFLHYAYECKENINWGCNAVEVMAPFEIFVSPNPSPANAQFSLADLQEYYKNLKAIIDSYY